MDFSEHIHSHTDPNCFLFHFFAVLFAENQQTKQAKAGKKNSQKLSEKKNQIRTIIYVFVSNIPQTPFAWAARDRNCENQQKSKHTE